MISLREDFGRLPYLTGARIFYKQDSQLCSVDHQLEIVPFSLMTIVFYFAFVVSWLIVFVKISRCRNNWTTEIMNGSDFNPMFYSL